MDKARKWKLKRNRAKRLKMKPQRQQAKKELRDVQGKALQTNATEDGVCQLRSGTSHQRDASLSFEVLLLLALPRNCRIP